MLNNLSIKNAIMLLKTGDTTSVELTKYYLDRIEKFDPTLRIFITITKDLALDQAAEADRQIKTHGEIAFETKPLLGIPFVLKDNYSTKGVKTTAASNVLKNYVPPFNATVTQKLLDAGAVLLGKANMDAFAHGSSTETSDIFPLHSEEGPTKNPWNIKHSPGGSSGGSAAAVAADLCTFAMGTETGGSIRGPASWCGVTGYKPTYGRASRYGIVAMASSTDVPGPITRTALDAAYIMNIISGYDIHDATTSPVEVPDYTKTHEKSLKGLKIGYAKEMFNFGLQPGMKEELHKSIDLLSNEGAEIVEIELLDLKYSVAVYTILQRAEVSSNLARITGVRYGETRDNFGMEATVRQMLGAYVLSAGYYDQYYSKAQKVRTLIVEDFDRAFNEVDVLVGPTMSTTAIKIGGSEESSLFGELADCTNEPSSIAGLCSITVPAGFVNELPIGLQFIGNRFDDHLVLSLADHYQSLTDFHTKFPQEKSYAG